MFEDILGYESDLTDITEVDERLKNIVEEAEAPKTRPLKRVSEQPFRPSKRMVPYNNKISNNVNSNVNSNEKRRKSSSRLQKPEFEPAKREFLSEEPIIELAGETGMDKILSFFKSPCPVIFCGPDFENQDLFGVPMEYYLRVLIGAEVGGPINDIISWADRPNVAIAKVMHSFELGEEGRAE